MALRNIDTKFYKEGFVRSLPAHLKTFYSFIMTDCEADGIWTADLQIASLYIGSEVTEAEFQKWFIDTGKAVFISEGKCFLPEFISMQYPKGLNEKNPSQTNIIARLKGLGLLGEGLTVRGRDRMINLANEALAVLNDNILDGLKIVDDIEFTPFVNTEEAIVEAGVMLEEYKKAAPKKKAAKVIVEQVEGVEVSDMQKRIDKFKESLQQFNEEFGAEMVEDFFKYWTEPNKSNTKFKRELHATWEPKRRLETWRKNDKNWQKQQKAAATESDYDKAKNL